MQFVIDALAILFSLPLLVLCSSYFFPPYLDTISIRFQYFLILYIFCFCVVLLFGCLVKLQWIYNAGCHSWMFSSVLHRQSYVSVPVWLYAANVISLQQIMSSNDSEVAANRKLIWKYQPCFYFPLFRLRAALFLRSFDWRSCHYLGSFHFITTKSPYTSLLCRWVWFTILSRFPLRICTKSQSLAN